MCGTYIKRLDRALGVTNAPAWVRRLLCGLTATAGLSVSLVGCRNATNYAETIGNDTAWVNRVVAEVDAGAPPTDEPNDPVIQPVTLRTLAEQGEPEYWEISLDEVISQAMSNSNVLRDLGGTILSSPQGTVTRYTRGLQQSDPRFGMEAALSQFDAQFNALATFQDNERVFNNRFLGGGANLFIQDRHDYIAELTKRSATGATFALRNVTDYDANNAPGNIFSQAWQTQWEGEVRQPLLQGGGVAYNRIAGPNGTIGEPNGVLIAKVNQDVTNAEFQIALRNYLSDVINAYWDLYYAYRDLDSKQALLDGAREAWQSSQAKTLADQTGGVREALAREQYYRFEAELQDAISGRVAQRTQNRNGATGGAFRGVSGVQAAERRLRLLIGMPVNDVRILRPNEEPEVAPVVWDWEAMAGEAIYRRPELQKQRLLVKRREMELIAARNFLAPRLDMFAKYRLRGLGHDLAGDQSRAGLRSAYGEVLSGQFDEYEVGLQLNVPIGFRQAHAAVQNAEMQMARERAVLKEQERQVLHDLSDMVAEVDRAWSNCQSNLNRFLAAQDAMDAIEADREAGRPVDFDQVLDVRRRLAEAQSQYYFARTEYALAIKNVHLERGALFEYGNVMIAGMQEVHEEVAQEPARLPAFSDLIPVDRSTEAAGEASLDAPLPASGRASVDLFDPDTLTLSPLGEPTDFVAPVAPVPPEFQHAATPADQPGRVSLAPTMLGEPAQDARDLFAPVPLPGGERRQSDASAELSTPTDSVPDTGIQPVRFEAGLFDTPSNAGLLTR
ncbi:MAG: TolC family protein [Planctomycetaceae bacterium]